MPPSQEILTIYKALARTDFPASAIPIVRTLQCFSVCLNCNCIVKCTTLNDEAHASPCEDKNICSYYKLEFPTKPWCCVGTLQCFSACLNCNRIVTRSALYGEEWGSRFTLWRQEGNSSAGLHLLPQRQGSNLSRLCLLWGLIWQHWYFRLG